MLILNNNKPSESDSGCKLLLNLTPHLSKFNSTSVKNRSSGAQVRVADALREKKVYSLNLIVSVC